MRNYLLVLSIILFFSFEGFTQTYILNEDFSTASSNNPPVGWINNTISGEVQDVWRFDNPGSRIINFPVNGVFAIFDSEWYSQDGVSENVALQSPSMDCSVSNNIFLFFDHFFAASSGAQGFVEVFNGNEWIEVMIYTDSTQNSSSEMINISTIAGGVTNASVRFRFSANDALFWAIDNIRIYAPLASDAGVTAITNPSVPLTAGVHNIIVNLKNFGAETLNDVDIQWSVNDTIQPVYNWSGALPFDSSLTGIVIGSYSFPAGATRRIKVWTENPNGGIDLNAYNDTVSKYVYSELCGTYTIGGITPDFIEIEDAVNAMEGSGINCPIVFKIRDGIYNEQIHIEDIPGNSSINTITFESESGDSSQVVIKNSVSDPINDYTVKLENPDFVVFKGLSIQRENGDTAFVITGNSHDITIQNCIIDKATYSPVTTCNNRLRIDQNVLEDVFIYAPDSAKADSVIITNNYYQQSKYRSIQQLNLFDNNVFHSESSNNILYGVKIENCDTVLLFRNNVELINSMSTNICSGPYHVHALMTSNNSFINLEANYFYAFRYRQGTAYGFLSENDSIIFSYGNYYSPNSEHCAPKRGVEINGAYDINLTADTLDSNYEYNCDGIRISSPIHSAVIDSCNIQSIYSTGIYLNNNLGAICDITNNRLVHLNDRGMYIEGDSVYISNNEIQNFRRYEGIFLNANNSYCGNNIINDLNGYGTYSGNPHPTGIAVLSDSNVIENNRIFDGDFLSYILNIQGDYNTISNNQFSDINIFETTYAFNVSGDYNTIQRDSCIELIGEGYYLSGTGNVINASKLLKQSEGVGVLLEGKQSRVTNNFFSLEGLGNAIGVQINEGSDSSLVAFNSVMVNSSDEMNGIALKLEGGDSVQVVNNIFSNNGQGYAGYFALDDLSAYTLDHNVYYSFNEKVGYFNALNYTSFSDLQSAINQETYSAYYNPFYVSVSDLTPTQGLIDNMGMVIPGIDADIDFVMRDAVTPDVGAIEFEGSPCDPNAGLLQFVEITNPLPTGLLDVKVSHINFGNAALIKDTIRWEVNGVSQTPYVWAGNLANAESDTVTIGSILIESGNLYSFKAWTDFPNDIEDCAPQNDTIWKNNLGTELCGTYTVGWDTADFVNMAEVQAALNGGGVGCDVTFILKDTVFYEQFRLGNIVGNADTATITFQSYSLDSNSCELRYTPSNPTNDFVVKLDGADYVTFKGIKFYRNTSTSSSISYEAIRINNESHNILFDRCWIVDDVISEPNSVDSCITFRKCNIDNGSISIRNPIGIYGKQYLIDSSNVDNDIVVDQASSLTVKGSSFRRLIADTITDVLVQNSTSYYTGSSIYPMFSVLDLAVCNNITVSNNNFYSQPYYYNAQSIFLDKCSNVLIDSNSIYCRARRQNAAIGIYANQNENIQILNNRIRVDGIVDYDDYPNQIGIQILDSDSIIIRKDSIFCINPEEQGHGIYLRDNTGFVQVDSSYIYGMRDHGLYIEVGSDSTMITSNHIDSCGLIGLRVAQGLNGVFNNNQITRIQRDNQFSTGILVEGLKAKFYDNYLYEIHGTGMEIQGDSTKVFANQILRIEDGAGLIINSKYDSVYNNWIACYGAGSSKGVFIDSLSASSQILHNSIHNVSSNINSQSLCIKSSANNTIKNNIFSNTGQGYSVYSGVIDMSNLDMDYNSYYSLDNKLGYFQNNLLTSLNAWQQSTGLDAHSQGVNPFFTSNTDLSFNQGLINDAADPVIWIDEDIFHSARSVTPDIGAMECDASACTPNAGLNDFVNIINPLSEGLTSIVVELSNQAATVLDSVQIEWSINGMSQAPFYWYGSLSYNEVDTVTIGSYNFVSGDLYDIKAWVDLPNGIEDCNHLNDTIQMNDLGTTLCGVYTIGGLDADFINFDAAEYILMTAGISCDVTFMVRDGVYHNQLFLSDISGMTDTNRIQFVGESQDSSAVEILYYLNDDDNDYTVMLDHSMNISFENIFINRLQGDTSVVIKGSGKNLSFENCMIKEKFISYANSNDSLIRMVNCNLEELVCFSKVDSLSILNSQMPMLIIDSVTNYQLIGNTIDNSSSLDTEAGIISNSSNGNIEGNYFSAVATNYDWAKALQLNNDSIISCIDNTVYASGHDDF
ncbi:MAG: hypothetical protein C0594_17790 [Marinilabiliales bacterium]|nr:MAG: hypothetical protein C0594_17790 [Marinilabiliales bacterium]